MKQKGKNRKKPRPISERMTNAIITKCEAHAELQPKNISTFY